jgi:hypothetical protein
MCEIDAANLEGAAAMVRPTGSREEANKTALEKGSTDTKDWFGDSSKNERHKEGVETKIEFFGHLAPGRNWLTISTDQEGA